MRPLRSPGVRALVVVAFAIGLGLVAWASLGTTDLLDAWYPSSESGYWSDPTTDPLGPGRPPPPAARGATRNAARGNTARGSATRGATGNATRGSATDDAGGARGAAGSAGGAAEDARGAENAAPGAAGNTAGGAEGARGATDDTAEDTGAATRAAAEDTTEDAEETQAADLARVWWVLGGIALTLLLAVVVLAIRVNRRRRRAAPPESAREAPDRALLTDRRAARQARMLREGSPREAIIATWLDLERLVAAAGVPRRPSETSSELVVRVLDDREVPAAALTDLAALFREARFSTHELTEALRERAAGDLDAVHAALGARGRGAES
ncbi:DUF4129 domain-containing protein [Actinomyces dentalis]|uniref:DUF4129 domain-containing protein n=1 Tax=Actinomyces dentalis TaxID=272548 RepID=UPI0003FCC2A9|nr:DUF4129 domain-containing protein [Actinomyces dentalis]